MTSFIKEHDRVYAMLHQFFNDISNCFLFFLNITSDFLKQIIFLKLFNSVFLNKYRSTVRSSRKLHVFRDMMSQEAFNTANQKKPFDILSRFSSLAQPLMSVIES